MMPVMSELAIIMTTEWSAVAMLYELSEKRVRKCRSAFVLKRSGVSVYGFFHVFLSVGMNATRSIDTTMMTESVGSSVSAHGMSPKSAIARKILSVFVTCFHP